MTFISPFDLLSTPKHPFSADIFTGLATLGSSYKDNDSSPSLGARDTTDPKFFESYFKNLGSLIKDNGVDPHDIYNMGECGFRVGTGGSNYIVTLEGSKPAWTPTQGDRTLVTVVECIGASGTCIPPFIIVPGSRIFEKLLTNDLPSETKIATSLSGYSNDQLALKWLYHFGYNTKGNKMRGTHRLLLMDGHGSHLTQEFIEYADANKILLICLPPHSTHALHPLDVTIFGPMTIYHKDAVEIAYRSGATKFNKTEFLASLSSIRKQSMKAASIKSAFRNTGIHPLNPEIVLTKIKKDLTPTGGVLPPFRPAQPLPRHWQKMSRMEQCAWKEGKRALLNDRNRTGWAPWDRPSDEDAEAAGTEVASEGEDEVVLAFQTPEPDLPSSDPIEPTVYEQFKWMSEKMRRHEVERNGRVSPTTDGLLRGCRQIILAGDLVAQNAHDNSAIIAERKKREAMANRVVQTGGVITIKDALRMKRAREGDDIGKEARAEKKRQTKRDKLLAVDNKRRQQQGSPEIPDHADPVLNPDYIRWDELQRTSYYAEWYQTQQHRSEEDEEISDFAQSENSENAEEDDLGRWSGDSEEDPFL